MYITGKKARSFVNQYYNTQYRSIHDVYKQPSQTFTAAWYYTHPDTGVLMLHVETYKNSYDMEM